MASATTETSEMEGLGMESPKTSDPSHSPDAQLLETDGTPDARRPNFFLPLCVRKALWGGLYSFGSRPTARLANIGYNCLFGIDTDAILWYFCGPKAKGTCALTIDDAPGYRPLLREVLELLDRYGAKATFFITANYVEHGSNRRYLRQILERGHTLGNHMCEDRVYSADALDDFLADLARCQAVIEEAWDECSVPPPERERWYRPPSGRLSSAQARAVVGQGYRIALGDVFANDVFCAEAAFLGAFAHRHLRPGSVLIVHTPERGFREESLPALEQTLQSAERKQLKCVALQHLDRAVRSG